MLISATNPENGTVNYYYGNINPYSGAPNNVYNKLAAKVDAKGQVVAYSYDSLARLIEVQKYPSGISGGEDTCQQEIYYYDSNPFPGMSGYSQNAIGRLTGIQYYAPATGSYMARGTSCQTKIQEQYSYKPSGLVINKGMLITRTLSWSTGSGNTSGPSTADLESSYTYDTEGRMLSVQYPGLTGGSPGPNLGYMYDTMGRLNQMIDQATSNTLISSATYDPASRLTQITGSVYGETRTYNGMGQLITVQNNSGYMTYSYSATQNNGKITGQTDISGEQVVYAYDALNRLASAAATSNAWGQSYAYDGFGNLTDQTTTAGAPPGMHLLYNAQNHPSDVCADANGNLNAYTCNPNTGTAYAYDVSNRIVSVPGNTNYAYAPGNKRIWRGTTGSGNTLTLDEITFWSVSGQKLATYNLEGDPAQLYSYNGFGPTPAITYTLATSNYYFGRKLIGKLGNFSQATYFGSDRLGSIGKYYPWGQEKPSATTNGTEKFTGYFRDSETQLDYADQRYHQPGMGRFLTPDPYHESAGPQNPGSWNRYAYVLGDPINYKDRTGLDCESVGRPLSHADLASGGGCNGGSECDQGDDFCCEVYGDCEGGGDPDPQPPAHKPPPQPSCSITIGTTGAPINQSYNWPGIPPHASGVTQLGAYNTVGSPMPRRDQGWWFAFQVQGSLSGDTNSSDWNYQQTLTISGTAQVAGFNPSNINMPLPNDNPPTAGVFNNGSALDWLDAPGWSSFAPNGGSVSSTNLKFSFTDTITNKSGQSCTKSWSLTQSTGSGASISAERRSHET